MGADIAGLPKGIVGRMGQKLSPFRGAAAQEFGVGFSQRAHAQEEVITISGVEVEGLQRLMQWIPGALGELIEKIEILREKERAIVVKIIAHEPIGNRCLGGRRLQRRMGIDHAHGGVKSRIGNAEHSHLSIAIPHVFHEPVNAVPSVSVFVRVFRAFVGIEGPHVLVGPFRTVAATDILGHQYELVPRQRAERTGRLVVVIRPVRLERIRGACQDDRP